MTDEAIKAALREAAWADCRATNAGLRCANKTPCSACEKEAAAAIEAFLRALPGIPIPRTGLVLLSEDSNELAAAVSRAAKEGGQGE